MQVNGATVAVVGMARSGLAAAELLIANGASVRAIEGKITPELRDKVSQLEVGLFPQEESSFEGVQLVVTSPGVPVDDQILSRVRARGIRVVGEVELACWYLEGPIIGITGSNGKTTTTALTGHILEESGVPARWAATSAFRPPLWWLRRGRTNGMCSSSPVSSSKRSRPFEPASAWC